MSQPSITELAARIAANTEKINQYYLDKGLPLPSFDQNGPTKIPRPDNFEIEMARQAVILDTNELRILLQGPSDYLTGLCAYPTELIGLQAIVRFRLAHAVPLDGEATFAELALKSSISEKHMQQLLRVAMAQHIFREAPGRPGVVIHTPASKVLVEDDLLFSWVAWYTGEGWAASYRAIDAMSKWPGSAEPDQTGFALAHGKGMYDYLSDHPDSLKRFADMMRYIAREPSIGPEHLINGYPWDQLGEATIVDLGGSHGVMACELARKNPSLKFIVQDLDEPVIREAQSRAPPEVADRVQYMVHDFLKEQPPTVTGVDVFLLRSVLHNWSDEYAKRILRKLIPAMKPGSKIIINDLVTPPPGAIPPPFERTLRNASLLMNVNFNSSDRELPEWERLIKDAGFEFEGAYQPPGGMMHVLKATWRG